MTFQTGEGRTDSFMDCTEIELSDEMTKDCCSFAAGTLQYKGLAIRQTTNLLTQNTVIGVILQLVFIQECNMNTISGNSRNSHNVTLNKLSFAYKLLHLILGE